MAINWRRGLLRLWIVLSAVWVAGVAAIGLYYYASGHLAEYEVTDPHGARYLVTADAAATQAEVLEYVKTHFGESERSKSCDTTPDKDGWQSLPPPWCNHPLAVEMPGLSPPSRSHLRFLAVLALAVPAVLFMFGIATLWVLAGFR